METKQQNTLNAHKVGALIIMLIATGKVTLLILLSDPVEAILEFVGNNTVDIIHYFSESVGENSSHTRGTGDNNAPGPGGQEDPGPPENEADLRPIIRVLGYDIDILGEFINAQGNLIDVHGRIINLEELGVTTPQQLSQLSRFINAQVQFLEEGMAVMQEQADAALAEQALEQEQANAAPAETSDNRTSEDSDASYDGAQAPPRPMH